MRETKGKVISISEMYRWIRMSQLLVSLFHGLLFRYFIKWKYLVTWQISENISKPCFSHEKSRQEVGMYHTIIQNVESKKCWIEITLFHFNWHDSFHTIDKILKAFIFFGFYMEVFTNNTKKLSLRRSHNNVFWLLSAYQSNLLTGIIDIKVFMMIIMIGI